MELTECRDCEGKGDGVKILLADDDDVSRVLAARALSDAGYDVVHVSDGAQAWSVLDNSVAPRLLVLDWMMPHINGIELCRKIRTPPSGPAYYIILLTSKGEQSDILEGFEAGADDYLTKPFAKTELSARGHVGGRIVDLQKKPIIKNRALKNATNAVKKLQSNIPVCMYCRKINAEDNELQHLEVYIENETETQLSELQSNRVQGSVNGRKRGDDIYVTQTTT